MANEEPPPARATTPAPARATAPVAAARTAAEWFDLACELDPASPDEARHAYEQALALDARLADAHINLGRLLHAGGFLEFAILRALLAIQGQMKRV